MIQKPRDTFTFSRSPFLAASRISEVLAVLATTALGGSLPPNSFPGEGCRDEAAGAWILQLQPPGQDLLQLLVRHNSSQRLMIVAQTSKTPSAAGSKSFPRFLNLTFDFIPDCVRRRAAVRIGFRKPFLRMVPIDRDGYNPLLTCLRFIVGSYGCQMASARPSCTV